MSFEGAGKIPEAPWEGPRIITLRNELNLSQEEMAKRIRVRLNTLKMWESGRGRATAWAVPRLDKMERKLGKSQAIQMAKKKGFIVRGKNGQPIYQETRKPGPRVIPTGSTTGRMVGARIRTLRNNIKAQSRPQATLEQKVAATRAQVLSQTLKAQKKAQNTPVNPIADARVQLLSQTIKNQKKIEKAPPARPANARVQLLKEMLRAKPVQAVSTGNPAADARIKFLSRMLKIQGAAA